jgi:fermentation-respiration switch protein FrsA (DUF1100 family)
LAWLSGAALLLAGGYLGLCLVLFLLQRGLMYHPDGAPLEASRAGPAWRLVESETSDGLRLRHLYRPAERGRPTLLLFQGNAGHAGHRADKLAFLTARGVGLFLVGYRGYGGNPGAPSETGLYADARSALGRLEAEGVPADALVLYGESLGTGVATKMAVELAAAGTPVGGLILEAPFASMGAAAQAHYPFVPARWLVKDRYDSLGRIAGVDTRLLVLHGEADRTVPFAQGLALYEEAREPKRLVALPGLGHVGHFERPEAVRAVREFVLGR